MTTLTMIWSDRNCAGMSEHHWHTMEFAEDRAELKCQGDWKITERIVLAYYTLNEDNIALEGETAADLATAALKDIGVVGIFIGIPEEL